MPGGSARNATGAWPPVRIILHACRSHGAVIERAGLRIMGAARPRPITWPQSWRRTSMRRTSMRMATALALLFLVAGLIGPTIVHADSKGNVNFIIGGKKLDKDWD